MKIFAITISFLLGVWQLPGQAQTLEDAVKLCANKQANGILDCFKRDEDQAGFVIKKYYKRQLINSRGEPSIDKAYAIFDRHRGGQIHTFYAVYKCSLETTSQHKGQLLYKLVWEVYEAQQARIVFNPESTLKANTIEWAINQVVCDESTPVTDSLDLRDPQTAKWYKETFDNEWILQQAGVRRCETALINRDNLMEACKGTMGISMALQKQQEEASNQAYKAEAEKTNCRIWEVPTRGNLNEAEWQAKLAQLRREQEEYCTRYRAEQANRVPKQGRPDWQTEEQQLRDKHTGYSQNNEGVDLINRAARMFFNR